MSPDEGASDAGAAPSAVVAAGLTLHGPRGLVYGPVDLTVPVGTMLIVQGTEGAGRSSLLLTMAGRMVPDRGSLLRVLGHDLPRARTQVQRRAAVAGFAGIDDLDESVRVSHIVRERLAWLAPWHRRVPRITQRTFAAMAQPIWGEQPVPLVGTRIWDLDEVDLLLLRITLAMAQQPDLLVVDDVDQVRDPRRRQIVWSRLEALTESGTTVIASVASSGESAAMSWTNLPQLLHLGTERTPSPSPSPDIAPRPSSFAARRTPSRTFRALRTSIQYCFALPNGRS